MDVIFKALGDETRRQLLDELHRQDGQTLSELEGAMAQHVSMTRFGIMKHLKVLEDASLVVTRKAGRFKHHYLNAVPLQEVIDRWIEPLIVKPAAKGMLDLKAALEGSNAMPMPATEKPDFLMSTFINCSQDALWDALTDAQANADWSYMPCSCTREGDALIYHFADGSPMLTNRETHLEPKTRIESTFEPQWAGPDVPLEASRFVFLIAHEGSGCKLTLEHYALPSEQRDDVSDGWARSLAGLKTLLETGKVVKFVSEEDAA
ncbi:MAG: helix-turn-helix domain-containing protein [Devosiaceae bacterium]|nr:helix-turn-helix domain-containing protein [Devosiaceae bacterium MH13]